MSCSCDELLTEIRSLRAEIARKTTLPEAINGVLTSPQLAILVGAVVTKEVLPVKNGLSLLGNQLDNLRGNALEALFNSKTAKQAASNAENLGRSAMSLGQRSFERATSAFNQADNAIKRLSPVESAVRKIPGVEAGLQRLNGKFIDLDIRTAGLANRVAGIGSQVLSVVAQVAGIAGVVAGLLSLYGLLTAVFPRLDAHERRLDGHDYELSQNLSRIGALNSKIDRVNAELRYELLMQNNAITAIANGVKRLDSITSGLDGAIQQNRIRHDRQFQSSIEFTRQTEARLNSEIENVDATNKASIAAARVEFNQKVTVLNQKVDTVNRVAQSASTTASGASSTASQAFQQSQQAISIANQANSRQPMNLQTQQTVQQIPPALQQVTTQIQELQNRINNIPNQVNQENQKLQQQINTFNQLSPQDQARINQQTQLLRQQSQDLKRVGDAVSSSNPINQFNQFFRDNALQIAALTAAIAALPQLLKSSGVGVSPCQAPIVGAQLNQRIGLSDAANKALMTTNIGLTQQVGSTANTIQTVVQATQTKLGKLAQALHFDKAMAALNFWMNLHNAYMLSSGLSQTLLSATSNVLAVLGVKDEEGSPLNLNQIFSQAIDDYAKALLGVEQVDGIKAQWKSFNRIYQAAANLAFNIQSMIFLLQDGISTIGGWIAQGFNGLRKDGVVNENTYRQFPENPNFKNPFFVAQEKLQNLTEVTSNIDMVATNILSINQTAVEIAKSKQELDKVLTEERKNLEKQGSNSKTVSKGAAIEDADTVIDPED